MYEVSLTVPIHINPACRVRVGVFLDVDTLNEICAFDASLDRGIYPIFPASETTFWRMVAEFKNDSFTTMFELNAVI